MLSGMSSAEYSKWEAFFSIEPFPELRADRRTAEIVQSLAALAGVTPPKLNDLMPDWWGEFHVKQSPEQIEAALNLALKPKRKKKK